MIRPTRRDDLRSLEAYHSPQLDVHVRLNTNESPFPPPAGFLDAWTDALRSIPLHRYPDRDARDLRAALATTVGCDPARLFCANGSNEVLQTLLLTYGGPGRSVVLSEPTYAMHSYLANLTGTGIVSVPRNADFTIERAAVHDAIDRARPGIVIICSPNNPTGNTVTMDEVVEFLEHCEAIGALLVVDEAYAEFNDASALALVEEDRNLVVTRTYSKIWSMAAVRLGFAIAPTTMVDELESCVPPYHLSAATQLAGLHALRYTAEMTARVGLIIDERERVMAALAEFSGLEVFPSGANFFLMRIPGFGRAVWEGLVEHKVLVRDFSHMPGLADCLRVTVGSPAENDAFLTAMRAVRSELGIGE